MSLEKTQKSDVVTKFQRHGSDTGSSEVQIALLSKRIEFLTEHAKANPKDFSSLRGLRKIVEQRKSLLSYLKKSDISRYAKVIAELKLRK